MLDKNYIFRRVNFFLFFGYCMLYLLNDLNITRISLPVDLSVCIVFFLCFNSIFDARNQHCNNKDLI
ncbi:hypothetical protein B7725_04505 [Streptococcus oralis subsp. tigurinus]|uniref:Uncharacterized protein n=1 Tax=Streptococcus oralis subsp. tigurinus TaxID=1077464 RepID=A0A1X1GM47_STROR|nr:hypothetical protein B7725_04505 [Streptococcus oralis subsp. tigurinus]